MHWVEARPGVAEMAHLQESARATCKALGLLLAVALCALPGQAVADCVIENGIVEAGEDCDDGNAVAADGCENDCSLGFDPAAAAR